MQLTVGGDKEIQGVEAPRFHDQDVKAKHLYVPNPDGPGRTRTDYGECDGCKDGRCMYFQILLFCIGISTLVTRSTQPKRELTLLNLQLITTPLGRFTMNSHKFVCFLPELLGLHMCTHLSWNQPTFNEHIHVPTLCLDTWATPCLHHTCTETENNWMQVCCKDNVVHVSQGVDACRRLLKVYWFGRRAWTCADQVVVQSLCSQRIIACLKHVKWRARCNTFLTYDALAMNILLLVYTSHSHSGMCTDSCVTCVECVWRCW